MRETCQKTAGYSSKYSLLGPLGDTQRIKESIFHHDHYLSFKNSEDFIKNLEIEIINHPLKELKM